MWYPKPKGTKPKNRVLTILQIIKKHVTWFLVLAMLAGIGVGLLWPGEVAVLKSWVKVASFLMIYSTGNPVSLNFG